MMVGDTDTTLSEHLHKLVGVKSEQELENLLKLLWQTRKIGLSAAQKASFQTLFSLPSPGDLDPVLASLRSLIRNCVHKNSEGNDILKLLPPDLPLELQTMLLVLLQKHRSEWKGELSQNQHVLGVTSFSHQLNASISVPLSSFSSSEVSRSFLSPHVDPVPQFSSHNFGGPTPITADRNVSCFPQLTLQNDFVPNEILGVLPRVKSMTWTVENKSAMPSNRVAIITLKLHDYTKSPSNEMEVKFQLTRDILEAVLRSMTYINQQLSRAVGSSSAPLQKKQRQ
ncbi:hypothetical protein BUALT_Bualt12G0048200 [Buddleja alternifolia]|uniref:COMM domain-containing protein n=1 Tax=Buddleja alternifolia TaxID=168488 RepID=A0AAV6WZD0_9LAMI|nr:hypothetical protein BUALT_Bualt12G0048200 [Buddleja alternifolia]